MHGRQQEQADSQNLEMYETWKELLELVFWTSKVEQENKDNY